MENRYHAVAIETESHLVKCLVSIDLNMVRAGVVQHPEQLSFSGAAKMRSACRRRGMV
jgi:putative transposase